MAVSPLYPWVLKVLARSVHELPSALYCHLRMFPIRSFESDKFPALLPEHTEPDPVMLPAYEACAMLIVTMEEYAAEQGALCTTAL